jgi:hypothetical protein
VYIPPFGGAGNKALAIDDAGVAQPIISWRSIFSNDPTDFQNGSIEFDLYLPLATGDQDWTFIDFRLGYGGPNRTAPTTVDDTTVWNSFRVNPGAALGFAFDHNTNSFLASISHSTVLHIRYDLNGAARTYRLTINGNPASAGGSVDRPWRVGATGVNMFGYFGAHPADSAPIYIDNIVVVNDDSEPIPWVPPADEPTNRLEWHQHRGNKRLTGEATIAQDIVTDAEVLWSDFIGSQESWLAVALGAGQQIVPIPTEPLSMTLSTVFRSGRRWLPYRRGHVVHPPRWRFYPGQRPYREN